MNVFVDSHHCQWFMAIGRTVLSVITVSPLILAQVTASPQQPPPRLCWLQSMQIVVAAFGNADQARLSAGGDLTRHQSEPTWLARTGSGSRTIGLIPVSRRSSWAMGRPSLIAHFAEAIRSAPKPMPNPLMLRLRELLARRRRGGVAGSERSISLRCHAHWSSSQPAAISSKSKPSGRTLGSGPPAVIKQCASNREIEL